MKTSRTLLANESGATAVEFALVASALIFTILFIMIVSLILYFQQALDRATTKAARQVMIGSVQKNSVSQANFQTQILCPYLPAAFNCGNVIVNLQTATEAAKPGGYYAFVNSGATSLVIPPLTNNASQYAPGLQQSYEYLQVIYPITFIPGAFASMLGQATFNGATAYLIVSTAAFKNEQY